MGGGGPEKPAEIPYEVVSTKEWGDQIAENFQYAPWHGDWKYWGNCPRCGHETSMFVRQGFIVRMITAVEEPPPPVTVPELNVECSCSHQHAPGKTGCGAYAVVYDARFE